MYVFTHRDPQYSDMELNENSTKVTWFMFNLLRSLPHSKFDSILPISRTASRTGDNSNGLFLFIYQFVRHDSLSETSKFEFYLVPRVYSTEIRTEIIRLSHIDIEFK
jgi:hypothetical protein